MIYIVWEYNLADLPKRDTLLGASFYNNVQSRDMLLRTEEAVHKVERGDPAPQLQDGDSLVIMGDGYDIWVSYRSGSLSWH